MSTRVVMDQGRALQIDPPRTIFRRPADVMVATTFIGTPAMNIIPATVETAPSGLAIELLGRQIPVALRHHPALQGLKRVEVGIQLQALWLVPPGADRITGPCSLGSRWGWRTRCWWRRRTGRGLRW